MIRNILRTGSCALGLIVLAGVAGCQPQSQNGSSSTSMLPASGTEGAAPTALVNQGRFPAPMYSQEVQPAYALTGDTSAQQEWTSLGHYYQVGNARINFPAEP
jgi:hypothetical protein